MLVSERTSGDRTNLWRRIGRRRTPNNAIDCVPWLWLCQARGSAIARMLGRSRRFVQEWVYVYRCKAWRQ